MEDNKTEVQEKYCVCCGRSQSMVPLLLEGNFGYICSDCVNQAFNTVREQNEKVSENLMSGIPKPHEIKEFLDQYIIGQDRVKERVAVAVYNHYKRISTPIVNDVEIEKSNICIVGPTGTGKTLIAKTVAKLLNVPFTIADATVLTESGYVGEDVESVLVNLYQASDYDVEKTERGIVFIDEIDKIARKGDNASISRDVSGEGVQQGLLKLLEGTDVYIDTGTRHGPSEKIRISSEKILFIAVGRFQALPDVIRKRLNQHQMGFDLSNGKDQDGNEIDSQNVIKYAEPEDFRKCGFIQEIVGRLPVITYVNPLTKEDLKRILLEPKNSIIKQYKKLFELSGKKLIIKDDVYDYIVSKGFKTDSGARGLRNVVENILKQKMFDSPSEPDKEVLIDMDYVKKVESKNFIDPTMKMEIESKKKMTL
jgi:ATP-dependent Clp protease ATP-binding subunit ClpX